VLQDGEGLVEVFEDADHRVVLLHILLGLLHRHLSVEASAVVVVPAKEHGLSPVVAEAVLGRPLDVATLGVARANARLVVLHEGGGRQRTCQAGACQIVWV
jgi:hypothetical protein